MRLLMLSSFDSTQCQPDDHCLNLMRCNFFQSIARRLVQSILFGLVIHLSGAPLVHAQDGELKLVQVAPRTWFAQGAAALGSKSNRNFISNAGFVVTDAGVVVIDALGSPAVAESLLEQIRAVTNQPIRMVIVTHYHADHIYGLQVFKDAGATILAHASGREYLNSETAQRRLEASREELAPWVNAQTRLVSADQWLERPVTLLNLGSEHIVIQHVGPAHTPEDLVVYFPQTGVLFAGDLFFQGRIPFVGQANSKFWIQSLERIMQFRPKYVVPGHGPISIDPMGDLQLTRDYLAYLRKSMGAAAREMEPFDEAYSNTDWSRFENLPLFKAANRMNAYNTYLLMERSGGSDTLDEVVR
jgi:glyoxylase-like metal-dependent hydrolase (beta-lactamase superfamily II)